MTSTVTAAAGGGLRSAAVRARRSAAVQRGAWLVLLVVVALSMAVGWHRPTVAPRAARIAAIEADVKCPTCEDLSVAVSTAPAAAAARAVIVRLVDAGDGTAAVEQYLVGRYGPGILLRPPTSGGTALVWELPVVAAVAALAGLGAVFWRRRRVSPVGLAAEDDDIVRRALAAAQDDDGAGGGDERRGGAT